MKYIAYLWQLQACRGTYPDFQKLPYWLGRFIDQEDLENWLRKNWQWAYRNAWVSHQLRPWAEVNQCRMMLTLYLDQLSR